MTIKHLLLVLLSGIVLNSCAPGRDDILRSTPDAPEQTPGLLMVPGQIPTPTSVRSVELYNPSLSSKLPVIRLGTNDRITLEFDELAVVSGQFRIAFSHHDKDWQQSSLPDPWIFDGINELFLRGGIRNQFNKPDYHHYTFRFPAEELSFKVSGNFMIHIYDFESGVELFSLPFFVTENEGELSTQTETIPNVGENGASIDQIFGKYEFPEYVTFPAFELSYMLTQNRFWNNSREADQISINEQGIVLFHNSRENAFAANFSFSRTDLRRFSLQSEEVYAFEPATIPPKVVLRDDQLNFTSAPNVLFDTEYGYPLDGRDAQYGSVHFRLNTGGYMDRSDNIYLIGDFNQWSISESAKMRLNREIGVLETRVLLKQGIYNYVYAVRAGEKVDPLFLTDALTFQNQEYVSRVYYLDPQMQYYRLMQFQIINSGSLKVNTN